MYQFVARQEEQLTPLSASAPATTGSGGLLEEANVDRFRIDCASFLGVNFGSYGMGVTTLSATTSVERT